MSSGERWLAEFCERIIFIHPTIQANNAGSINFKNNEMCEYVESTQCQRMMKILFSYTPHLFEQKDWYRFAETLHNRHQKKSTKSFLCSLSFSRVA
jgi:hypothetical protein